MTPQEQDARVRNMLYERYDRLNALYKHWESVLSRFHIPCPVEVIYERTADGWAYWLGMARCGGKWRIVHSSADECCPRHEMDWEPITECAVEHRVRAAKHIMKLAEAIPLCAERFLRPTDEAIASLESGLLATLPSGSSAGGDDLCCVADSSAGTMSRNGLPPKRN